MKIKDLKELLALAPPEADEWEVFVVIGNSRKARAIKQLTCGAMDQAQTRFLGVYSVPDRTEWDKGETAYGAVLQI